MYLYGDKYVYGGKNPFERVKIKLGVKDAELHSIRKFPMEGTILKVLTLHNLLFWK